MINHRISELQGTTFEPVHRDNPRLRLLEYFLLRHLAKSIQFLVTTRRMRDDGNLLCSHSHSRRRRRRSTAIYQVYTYIYICMYYILCVIVIVCSVLGAKVPELSELPLPLRLMWQRWRRLLLHDFWSQLWSVRTVHRNRAWPSVTHAHTHGQAYCTHNVTYK